MSHRNDNAVVALLDHGADLAILDKEGDSALHIAARQGSESTIEALLNAGVRINAPNQKGQTPLHVAVLAGNLEAVDVLVDEAADVNATWQDQTALAIAEQGKHAGVVEVLQRASATNREEPAPMSTDAYNKRLLVRRIDPVDGERD